LCATSFTVFVAVGAVLSAATFAAYRAFSMPFDVQYLAPFGAFVCI